MRTLKLFSEWLNYYNDYVCALVTNPILNLFKHTINADLKNVVLRKGGLENR